MKLVLDEDLRRFDTVWSAAGTPFSVFPLAPEQLQSPTDAPWQNIKEQSRIV